MHFLATISYRDKNYRELGRGKIELPQSLGKLKEFDNHNRFLYAINNDPDFKNQCDSVEHVQYEVIEHITNMNLENATLNNANRAARAFKNLEKKIGIVLTKREIEQYISLAGVTERGEEATNINQLVRIIKTSTIKNGILYCTVKNKIYKIK